MLGASRVKKSFGRRAKRLCQCKLALVSVVEEVMGANRFMVFIVAERQATCGTVVSTPAGLIFTVSAHGLLRMNTRFCPRQKYSVTQMPDS